VTFRKTHTFPKRCPHGSEWEKCCLEELLKMNPGLKREDIEFSDRLGWVEVPKPRPDDAHA
jgi:hypothetical protein